MSKAKIWWIVFIWTIFVSWITTGRITQDPIIIEKEVEVTRYQTEYRDKPIQETEKFLKCYKNQWEYNYTMYWDAMGSYWEEKCEF